MAIALSGACQGLGYMSELHKSYSCSYAHEIPFQQILIDWFKKNRRDYPWRKDTEPYRVLISEIMLQQTNADRVAQVYPQFLRKFPDVAKLALSKREELKSILKPLGLNYRAARLKNLAEVLLTRFGGNIPPQKEELLTLPTVGEYIANAVLCFAYSNRVPLVDINVVRLYERVFSLRSDKKRAREDPKLWEFAAEMMPVTDFKEYNWALIDFGAKICLSKHPRCDKCTIRCICNYFSTNNRSKSKIHT